MLVLQGFVRGTLRPECSLKVLPIRGLMVRAANFLSSLPGAQLCFDALAGIILILRQACLIPVARATNWIFPVWKETERCKKKGKNFCFRGSPCIGFKKKACMEDDP